jgi:hypothetical protein
MGQAQRVTFEATGTTVEYVRSRQVLRFAASGHDGTVEVPPAALLRELGIDVAELVPARHFLLFAGCASATAGGLGDLIAVFGTEAEARDQFQQLRLDSSEGRGWAEVAVLDAGGRLRRICWYGRRKALPLHSSPGPVSSRRRRRLRLIRRPSREAP